MSLLDIEYERLGSPEYEAERIKMQLVIQTKNLAVLEADSAKNGWTTTTKTLKQDYENLILHLRHKLAQFEPPILEPERVWWKILLCWR